MLSDVENARRWNEAWTTIEFTSPQHHGIGTRFRATTEAGDSFEFELCDWAAPDRLAFCPIREPGERYAIMMESHGFELHAMEDGATVVELTANASLHGIRGWILGTFFWSGHQKAGLKEALEKLAALFEGTGSSEPQETAGDT